MHRLDPKRAFDLRQVRLADMVFVVARRVCSRRRRRLHGAHGLPPRSRRTRHERVVAWYVCLSAHREDVGVVAALLGVVGEPQRVAAVADVGSIVRLGHGIELVRVVCCV